MLCNHLDFYVPYSAIRDLRLQSRFGTTIWRWISWRWVIAFFRRRKWKEEEEDETDAPRPPQGKPTCHLRVRARFIYYSHCDLRRQLTTTRRHRYCSLNTVNHLHRTHTQKLALLINKINFQ